MEAKGDRSWPLVSVLILTYNAESFIRESIESVLAQGYPALQIVVSDDLSKDGTCDILKEYQEKYPEVFTVNFNPVNLGITRNSNKALSLCIGDYVAFHAGDDVMLPGKIHEQVQYFERNSDCVLCYHNLELFDSDSGKVLGRYNNYRNKARSGSVRELIRHGCFIGGNSVMVRRSSLPAGGYNEMMPVASDWQLWIAVTIGGGTIGYIDKVLARYRRHAQNTTAVMSPLNRQAIMDALNTTNWVLVNHPSYSVDALKAYAVHLRLLRRLEGGKFYSRALLASLKVWPTLDAFGALALNFFSAGSVKK